MNIWTRENLQPIGEYQFQQSGRKMIREGSPEIKTIMEDLLKGKVLRTQIDEQIMFSQMGQKRNAIWSLFLASGYLKVENYELDPDKGRPEYELALTNKEVRLMFEDI